MDSRCTSFREARKRTLMKRLLSLGVVFGPILCCILAVQHYFFWYLEWVDPRSGIEVVEDHFTAEKFNEEVDRERRPRAN